MIVGKRKSQFLIWKYLNEYSYQSKNPPSRIILFFSFDKKTPKVIFLMRDYGGYWFVCIMLGFMCEKGLNDHNFTADL